MTSIRHCHWPLRDREREALTHLHMMTLPGVKVYPLDADGAAWWLAWYGDDAIGFAGARRYDYTDAAFFVAAGVLSTFRGHGLHKRLIRARIAWAKRVGSNRVVTYTVLDNVASANALIRAGFRRTANWDYVGSDVDYWERAL